MRRTAALSLLALVSLILAASAHADVVDSEEGPPVDVRPGLLRVLAQHEETIRNAPGRSGILSEKKLYSLFDEELIIRDFFQDRKGGFFLDVGCAWPIDANNTYYLEHHLGWTGIGIDALDDYAPGWHEKRSNSKFFAYLVSDRSGGTGTFFKSPNSGLSSTDRDLASGRGFGDDLKPKKVEIPEITLDDLLDREGVDRIDLLSLDIEGAEPQALAGFDIERFQPELVVVEGNDPVVTKYFDQHGYKQIQRYIPFDPINRYFERQGWAERTWRWLAGAPSE